MLIGIHQVPWVIVDLPHDRCCGRGSPELRRATSQEPRCPLGAQRKTGAIWNALLVKAHIKSCSIALPKPKRADRTLAALLSSIRWLCKRRAERTSAKCGRSRPYKRIVPTRLYQALACYNPLLRRRQRYGTSRRIIDQCQPAPVTGSVTTIVMVAAPTSDFLTMVSTRSA